MLDKISGEGNGTPLQRSCLENPMDGRAWWAAVHGVAKSRTRLSDFTFTFHFHALEKEMATHFSVLAWRIRGTGEPHGLPSMRSHRIGQDWSDLAAAAAAGFQSQDSPLLGTPWGLLPGRSWVYLREMDTGLVNKGEKPLKCSWEDWPNNEKVCPPPLVEIQRASLSTSDLSYPTIHDWTTFNIHPVKETKANAFEIRSGYE